MATGTPTPRPPFSAFAVRSQEPDPVAVRQVLAGASSAWDDLAAHVADTYALESSFHFMYGERYGWALRFRKGDRLVLAMYPNHGRLVVQIILSRPQVAEAAAGGVPDFVSSVVQAARDYPEGRWLFIPVSSVDAVRQLRPLIALKVSGLSKRRAIAPRKRAAQTERTGRTAKRLGGRRPTRRN